MTVTEALLEGLKVTAVGLAIVFSVLIILMVVLTLMKYIFANEPKSTAPAVPVAPAKPVEAAAPAAKAKDDVDEEELIAVLTAAIAASLNTSTYNLQIKSYRRIGNNSPAWNQAGLRDTIDSRF